MSNYYYLVTGLPDLTLDDNKLSYSTADFKTEFYPRLSAKDKKLFDLFYLQFDNANVLKLLKDKEAVIDTRGMYSAEELLELLAQLKENNEVSKSFYPAYLVSFISDYYHTSGDEDFSLFENRLAGLYYDYAMHCDNSFVAQWYEFNLTVNNILVALTARKYKMDVSSFIVGNTEVCQSLRTSNARDFGLSGEVDYMDQLMKISETEGLLEREKKIDQMRWAWMENATFFNYFSVEKLFVFLLQLKMIERWMPLDKEKGNQRFRSIIASLKDGVQIPAEFR